MGAEVPVCGIPAIPLFRLQERYGLSARQRSLMDANAVAPNLRPEWEQRRKVNDIVLRSAQALLEKVHYSPLLFADLPRVPRVKTKVTIEGDTEVRTEVITNDIIGVDTIERSQDLRFIAVPVFPMESSAAIMRALEPNSTSPFVDIYEEDPLRAMAGGLPVNKSGHYVFMNAQGENAELWHELGLNGNHDVSVDKVRLAVQEKGDSILGERGLSGATIDIATLEELMIHNALFDSDNPIYGITSTRIPGTNQYVMATPDGYQAASSDDISTTPPLVIRLGKPDLVWLRRPREKAAEPTVPVVELPDESIVGGVVEPVAVFDAATVIRKQASTRRSIPRTDFANASEQELIDIAKDYVTQGSLRRRAANDALDRLDDAAIASSALAPKS